MTNRTTIKQAYSDSPGLSVFTKRMNRMDIAADILNLTTGVTKKWTKQRKAEERSSRARYNREQAMYSSRISFTEVMHRVIPEAYNKASNGGALPAHARQIFYVARPLFL